jgi:hypothetical protein
MPRYGPFKSELTTHINLSGPIFTHDGTKTFLQNVRVLMDAMATEGAKEAQTRVRATPRARPTGRRADIITGRTHAHAGKRWAYSAVIGIPMPPGGDAAQSIRDHAAMAEIERKWHPIRGAVQTLQASAAVNRAELAKGLG